MFSNFLLLIEFCSVNFAEFTDLSLLNHSNAFEYEER